MPEATGIQLEGGGAADEGRRARGFARLGRRREAVTVRSGWRRRRRGGWEAVFGLRPWNLTQGGPFEGPVAAVGLGGNL